MLASLSSCLGGKGEDPVMTTTIGYVGYNHVYSANENKSLLKAASYKLDMNFIKMTVNLTIESAYTENGDPVTIKLDGLSMKADEQGYSFSAPETVPETDAGNPEDYKVENLKGKVISYILQDQQTGTYNEVIVLETSFRISGKYDVFVCSTNPTFPNCKTETYSDGGDFFSTTATTYNIKFEDSKSATVTLNNARFAAGMPQMTMVVEKVPVEILPDGYRLHTDEIIPKVNGTPIEKFAMHDFELTVNHNGTAMNLSFGCDISGKRHTANAVGSLFPKTDKEEK